MPRLIDADVLLGQMKHRRDYVGRPSDPVCLVEDAPTVGGWVSVKDRLPDKSGAYLVMLENVFATHLAINVHYWNAKDGYWRGSEAHSRIVGISHWMTLPEPPEEDEKHG